MLSKGESPSKSATSLTNCKNGQWSRIPWVKVPYKPRKQPSANSDGYRHPTMTEHEVDRLTGHPRTRSRRRTCSESKTIGMGRLQGLYDWTKFVLLCGATRKGYGCPGRASRVVRSNDNDSSRSVNSGAPYPPTVGYSEVTNRITAGSTDST